jgi:SOS-response transcriptional repressor LexA
MAAPGAFSWNSELPSGRNPFWIRDESLAGLDLHSGDAVSVDTQADPADGDLVVVDVELEDDSVRTARRFFHAPDDRVRLEPVGDAAESLELPAESVIVMGVIRGRLRFASDQAAPTEEPLLGDSP